MLDDLANWLRQLPSAVMVIVDADVGPQLYSGDPRSVRSWLLRLIAACDPPDLYLLPSDMETCFCVTHDSAVYLVSPDMPSQVPPA